MASHGFVKFENDRETEIPTSCVFMILDVQKKMFIVGYDYLSNKSRYIPPDIDI